MLATREAVGNVELIIYVPAIAVAVYTNIRHGFMRHLAWIYLTLFCALRIASAAMEIVSAQNPQNTTNFIWAGVLSAVGLSPLLLTSLALLKVARDSVTERTHRLIFDHILHVLCLLAIVLSIWGGVRLSSSSNPLTQSTGVKIAGAGIIILLSVYVGLSVLAILTVHKIRRLPSGRLPEGKNRVLVAVIATLPVLFVRMLYSILSGFRMHGAFSIIYGNPVIYLCMAVLEEIAIVIMYLSVGVSTPSLKKRKSTADRTSLQNRPSNDPENGLRAQELPIIRESEGKTQKARGIQFVLVSNQGNFSFKEIGDRARSS